MRQRSGPAFEKWKQAVGKVAGLPAEPEAARRGVFIESTNPKSPVRYYSRDGRPGYFSETVDQT